VVRQAIEPYRLARSRSHKLIVWESGRQSLYDIRGDISEERDLIREPSARATAGELRAALAARMRETGDHALQWLGRG
jgi:hypothetical protein